MGEASEHVDVLVIGGGPAGLSAATWLGRHRRSTLVVDAGEQRNRFTDEVHGVLGHEGISPGQLLDRARGDLDHYPHVELRTGRVTDARRAGDDFTVVIDDTDTVSAQRLIFATGVVDELPDVAGFYDHYGTDVFHCPTCDGYQARDRTVAVFGWGEHVPAFAAELLDWAKDVRIITDHRDPEITPEQRRRLSDRGIDVRDGLATRLLGEAGSLRGVVLEDGTEIEATMAFFSVAHHPVVDLARQLGCALTPEGCVDVDDKGHTTIEGVYAAGDLTPGPQLVGVAAAEGTVAGVSCATSFHGHDSVATAPTPAPDQAPLTPEAVPAAGPEDS